MVKKIIYSLICITTIFAPAEAQVNSPWYYAAGYAVVGFGLVNLCSCATSVPNITNEQLAQHELVKGYAGYHTGTAIISCASCVAALAAATLLRNAQTGYRLAGTAVAGLVPVAVNAWFLRNNKSVEQLEAAESGCVSVVFGLIGGYIADSVICDGTPSAACGCGCGCS